MKVVVITNHGNGWIIEVSQTQNGGLNLSEGEFVVAAFPYLHQ